MLIRLANFQTAVIVLLSVLALFFFPAPRGSFVSTHGPITSLWTCCEAAFLWVSMALALFRSTFKVTLRASGPWVQALAELRCGPELPGLSVLRI